jgi:hypothetical protein
MIAGRFVQKKRLAGPGSTLPAFNLSFAFILKKGAGRAFFIVRFSVNRLCFEQLYPLSS